MLFRRAKKPLTSNPPNCGNAPRRDHSHSSGDGEALQPDPSQSKGTVKLVDITSLNQKRPLEGGLSA